MTLQTRTAPRLFLRLLVVALVALLAGGGFYFQGWYTECRPGRPGGEACNIAMGFGLLASLVLAFVIFMLGLIVVLILQWLYQRRAARLN